MPASAPVKTEAQKKAAAASKAQIQKRKEEIKQKATANITKLLKAGKKVTKQRVRHSVHFHLPKTLVHKNAPKYSKKSITPRVRMDKYRILKAPLTTETAMKLVEDQNSLVFLVDLSASKTQIKKAFKEMFQVKPLKVRTLIRPTGDKKAIIKLGKDAEAVDIASRVGII